MSGSQIAEPIKERPVARCRECNGRFRKGRHDQVFCQPKCKQDWFRRAQTRGAQAYSVLLKWRKSRGKEVGIGEVAHIVDQWIAADRKAGRG